MAIQSSRHRAVLEELTEWWEDLRDRPDTGGMPGSARPVSLRPAAVVASRFVRQERFKVVSADQPAASCLYRPELAGAQQVVDELLGDAQ
jgi:hypothetical protein